MGPSLVYSETCPYCLTAKTIISALDVRNTLDYVPIESDEGQQMVRAFHGEFVDAPHLFTDDWVAYGVGPVGKRLPRVLAFGDT